MPRFLLLAAATTSFTSILDQFGALAVFVFVLVENFGAPIPGETMLVAASAYAAAGHINIVVVVLFCIAGVWSGSTLSYLAGRRGGVLLLRRLHVPERHLAKAQSYMTRWGSYTVVFGRYVAFLRSYIGWLAGINEMALGPFMLWNFVGATLWTVTFAAIGYVLGNNWALIQRLFATIGYGGLALVIVAVVAYLIVRRLRSGGDDAPKAPPHVEQQPREETLIGRKH